MKISVIIPMYNEASVIDKSVSEFAGYMERSFTDYELLFCDDGSTDGCGNAVLKYSETNPRVRLLRYENNRGKGCAVRTGMLASTGDIAMFTDCDNAYGCGVIGDVYDYFEKNKDISVVVGSRNLSKDGYSGYTFIRKLASKVYIMILNLTAGFRLTDSQCGMKGFRADAAKTIFSSCETDGFAFDLEVLMTAAALGYRIGETPVRVVNHHASKIHVISDSFKMLSDLVKIKSRVKKKNKKAV